MTTALAAYRRAPLVLALLALGVVAPYELIVLAVTGNSPFGNTTSVSTAIVLSLIDNLVVGGLISSLYVHALRTLGEGRRPELAAITLQGLRVLPTVIAAQIIATIGIAAGIVAFIIPGVILAIRWAVVAQAAAIENENWVEALRRSGQLTAHHYLHVLGLLLISGLIVVVLTNAGVAVAGAHATAGAVVLGIVVETIARSFVALTSAVLFFDLLARRELRPA